MTELYLECLGLLGLPLPTEALRTRLQVAPPAPAQTPVPEGQALLAVAAGAAFGPSKRLPLATLAQTIRDIRQQSGMLPVLLGSPTESSMLQELADAIGPPFLLPRQEHLNLAESSALLRQATVFLGSDAGARHLASAHGVPQVVWYGPTDPAWSAHDLGRMTMVRVEGLDCLGCQKKHCPLAGHPCMTQLPAAELVQAVLQAAT